MSEVLKMVGLGGCGGAADAGGDAYGSRRAECDYWLSAGHPRIALAKILGVPFLPYLFNISCTFDSPAITTVPTVGADVKKLNQDIIIDGIAVSITNDTPPLNVFQTMSDFFFNYQSGIEATLDFQGTPRPSLVPNFTPVRSIGEIINSDYPKGWVIAPTQAPVMSFNARIALPVFPITVKCTFRGKTPVNDLFVNVTSRDAIEALRKCGVPISDNYAPICK